MILPKMNVLKLIVLNAPERRCPTCVFSGGINTQVGHLRSASLS
ncbi:MAG: hypothetical protein FD161_873 [Limisphaerales bacterium]|nr:MAG: hypothetical protein FD161_873 [Limisphaerales bacterium]KAG0510032.1 MAG: hypothetical protein E1N63_873 [Limisphaerales bacterium]TXT53078.1 MAG: hypothetical protein FD140_186 [Limisphaerales bacterium]